MKLLPPDGELYVFAQSADRVAKERAVRRRQLKWLWARLNQLSAMRLTREELLMKLGAARQKTPTAWRLATIDVLEQRHVSYRLDRSKLYRGWIDQARDRPPGCVKPFLARARNGRSLTGRKLQLVALRLETIEAKPVSFQTLARRRAFCTTERWL